MNLRHLPVRAMAAVLAACVFHPSLQAQTPARPDAGSTQRDLEQRPLEVPRAPPPLPAAEGRPALQGDSTKSFMVTGVKISGNTAFPADVLLALVKDDLVGKRATLETLQATAAKITDYYRQRGYLVARAYIPAQRIDETGAEIEIAVLEGALGKLSLTNRSRLSAPAVQRFLAPLQPGTLLLLDTLERPVLLLSDQPGVGGISPVLRAGPSTGTSELALDLAPSPLASGELGVDNYGNRFTGQNRVTAQLNLLSPFGQGDYFSVRLIDSFAGLSSATARAALPLGGNGWKVGGSYGETRYRLGRDFAALQASGNVKASNVFVSYPWVRTQRWNLNATLAQDDKRLLDRVDSTNTVVPKHTQATSATLGGDVRDPFAANGVLVWSATATAGHLGIDDPATKAVDAATAMSQGSYRKYGVSLLYLQALGRSWTFYASVLAQAAGKNLDSSEKFSLGGAQGVRAYPVGEAAGDEGALATVELRYALPQWQGATPSLVLFADAGHARINRNAFAAGANNRNLSAAGPGVVLSRNNDFSLRAYWAAKLSGSKATADTDRSNRVWMQAVKFF